MKNPSAPAGKREVEEDWGRGAGVVSEQEHLVQADRHIADCMDASMGKADAASLRKLSKSSRSTGN